MFDVTVNGVTKSWYRLEFAIMDATTRSYDSGGSWTISYTLDLDDDDE